MAKRNVLLIGWRPEAVRALHTLGAEVTCVLSAGEDHEREGVLDDAHVVPVRNPADTESTLAGLQRSGVSPAAFDVVCSQYEFTLVNASVLGGPLAPHRPEDALLLRDKDLQKRRIRAAGIPVADSALVVRPGDLAAFDQPRGVLKPLAESGTRGVQAWRSPAERAGLAREFDVAAGPWLAEEWIDGPELHLDGIVRDGRVLFISVGRYLDNVLAIRQGGIVATVVQHPSVCEKLYDRCRELAESCMAALRHRDGVFHLEVFENGDRLVFGECGGRIPGGSFDEMIRRQHGVDLHDEWARAVLELDSAAVPEVADGWYGDLFLATGPGVLRSCPGEAEILAQPGVRHVVLRARLGDTLSDAAAASNVNAGSAVVEGIDEHDAADRIRRLASWFSAEAVLTPA
ncbi:acetyl-CoA carboxylase biotin carboxylase subunit family protein [Amycolatopsis sp. NPDC059021]|uniref:ATP-grasp domain-containing protein n=1 Tax=Amycolatopsis sp. NPDC059021 TaxID=3346704 RepID=UPI003671DB2D